MKNTIFSSRAWVNYRGNITKTCRTIFFSFRTSSSCLGWAMDWFWHVYSDGKDILSIQHTQHTGMLPVSFYGWIFFKQCFDRHGQLQFTGQDFLICIHFVLARSQQRQWERGSVMYSSGCGAICTTAVFPGLGKEPPRYKLWRYRSYKKVCTE